VLLAELEYGSAQADPALVGEIQRIPGVLSATVSTHTPLNGWRWSEPVVPAGQALPERDTALLIGAGPHFFSTFETQLIAGREFTERDRLDTQPVAIVNEAYAQRFSLKGNPVGLHLSASINGNREDLEIVGFVRNTRLSGLRAPSPATVYVPYYQLKPRQTTLSVRVAGPVAPVAAEIRKALQPRFPETPIEVRALSTQVRNTIVQERMMAMLAGGFAALALVLACIGLYGLLTYSVSRRTKEIGIRMALGAQAPRVVSQVVGGGARLVLAGIALGVPIVWLTSRGIESLLYGLTPTDPITLTAAIAALLVAAHVAAYLPARRASRVDPLIALRHE